MTWLGDYESFVRQHWGTIFWAVLSAVVVGKILWAALGAAARSLLAAPRLARTGLGTSGAAQTEFVVVMPILFLVLTGIAQMALVAQARLLVAHAAFKAVRAAMVIMPQSSGSEGVGVVGTGNLGLPDYFMSFKMNQVRRAAAVAMTPVSPQIGSFIEDISNAGFGERGLRMDEAYDGTADTAFGLNLPGPIGFMSRAAQKLIYASAATAVTFTGGPSCSERFGNAVGAAVGTINGQLGNAVGGLAQQGAADVIGRFDWVCSYQSRFERGQIMTAKVTHLFYCAVPLAARFAGQRFNNLPEQERLELQVSVPLPAGITALTSLPGFYIMISAEHSMPMQGV